MATRQAPVHSTKPKSPQCWVFGDPTEQGPPTTKHNESADVDRQGNKDEPKDDGKHDYTDEPEHDKHDVANKQGVSQYITSRW